MPRNCWTYSPPLPPLHEATASLFLTRRLHALAISQGIPLSSFAPNRVTVKKKRSPHYVPPSTDRPPPIVGACRGVGRWATGGNDLFSLASEVAHGGRVLFRLRRFGFWSDFLRKIRPTGERWSWCSLGAVGCYRSRSRYSSDMVSGLIPSGRTS